MELMEAHEARVADETIRANPTCSPTVIFQVGKGSPLMTPVLQYKRHRLATPLVFSAIILGLGAAGLARASESVSVITMPVVPEFPLSSLEWGDDPNLFSPNSHLACSPEARGFIESRLAQWEMEKESLAGLMTEMRSFYYDQLALAKRELADGIRINRRSHSRNEDWIGNDAFEEMCRYDSTMYPFMEQRAILSKISVDIDVITNNNLSNIKLLDFMQYGDTRLSKVMKMVNDDPSGESTKFIERLAAMEETASSDPQKIRQIAFIFQKLVASCQGLNELNSFMLDWLRQKKLRFVHDIQLLEKNQDTPSRLPNTATAPGQTHDGYIMKSPGQA